MMDVVPNMIVRLLNTNHSPKDAMKLVTHFLSMAIQKKLKLDPELVDEIILIVIHHFPEFVDQLKVEDMTRTFQIANDIQDVQPLHVPEPFNGHRAGAFLYFFGKRTLAWEKAHRQAKEATKEHTKQRIQIIQS